MTGLRRKVGPGEAVAGIAFALILVGILAYCSGPSETPQAPSSAGAPVSPNAAPPDLTLSAQVHQLGPALYVGNADSFAWLNCSLTVNPHGFLGAGFDQQIAAIRASDHALLDLADFATDAGERFDPARMKLVAVYIKCATPKGQASFFGSTPPAHSD